MNNTHHIILNSVGTIYVGTADPVEEGLLNVSGDLADCICTIHVGETQTVITKPTCTVIPSGSGSVRVSVQNALGGFLVRVDHSGLSFDMSEASGQAGGASIDPTVLDAKADLVGGKVPAAQLPAYVDDVLEADDFASLPVTGEPDKVYITIDTNKTYRWSGANYVVIGSDLALGETSSTAHRGDHGKVAYDYAQAHSNVDNTSDANKIVSNPQAAVNDAQDGASLRQFRLLSALSLVPKPKGFLLESVTNSTYTVTWTDRFLLIGGDIRNVTVSSYAQFLTPVTGETVEINGVDTVIADNKLPIAHFQTLWGKLPIDGVTSTTYAITSYNVAHSMDDTWIPLCVISGDTFSAVFPTGETQGETFKGLNQEWIAFSSGGGSYGDFTATRVGHRVYLDGLIKPDPAESYNVVITTLPSHLRPPNRCILGGCICSLAAVGVRVDITSAGILTMTAAQPQMSWLTFDGASFLVE